MWNSNSMTAWLIATAGLSTDHLRPPPHGRAPGLARGSRSRSTQRPGSVHDGRQHGGSGELDLCRLIADRPEMNALAAGLGVAREQLCALLR